MTPDTKHAFLDRVRETIRRHDLLPRAPSARDTREPVVVATSGGPDSVAMLLALHRLSGPGSLRLSLVVAHLNHGLREPTAAEDQVFVENLAEQLGLPCEVGRADVRTEAKALGVGIEEAARLARREFLADVARRREARRVALAHHADDRAETVLFHILRGTGVEGLAALGPRAPLVPQEGIEIVRPLIDVSRADILAFLKAAGQAYREDETNTSDAHTRNRLRSRLLPLLREEFNPKADEALVRLADQAAAASDVLRDVLDEVWRRIVREAPASGAEPAAARDVRERRLAARPRSFVIDADDFEPLRPWLQGAIIRRAIEHLGGGLKHMSAERTQAVVDALLSKTVAGPVDLPGGLVAERRRRAIRIGRRANQPRRGACQ